MSDTPDQPRDKADLLARIDAAHAELDAAIIGIPADQLGSLRDAEGWSVADHLAHLTAWERSMLALFSGRPRHEGLGIDRETYEAGDINAINAAVRATSAGQSADAVIAAFERTHADMMARVTTMSDDDLRQPYAHFLPDEPGSGFGNDSGDPILWRLCGNTADHFAEHCADLLAMRPA